MLERMGCARASRLEWGYRLGYVGVLCVQYTGLHLHDGGSCVVKAVGYRVQSREFFYYSGHARYKQKAMEEANHITFQIHTE